jgi:signal transduction histidine kinase
MSSNVPMDSMGTSPRSSRNGTARRLGAAKRPTIVATVEPAGLDDVLITQKLKSRRRRKPNAHAENAALHGLARVMATAPNELIDTLLRTALELCSAGTAGLSLMEIPPAGEPIFRWTNLAGALNKHVGGTTPRHFSPCGVTLDANAPQLFVNPGRCFRYLNALDTPIVEALVIPVDLGGEILGTIWIAAHDDEVKFDSEDARIMVCLAEFTGSALRMTRQSEMRQTARLDGDTKIAGHQRTEIALRKTQAHMEMDIAARAAQLEQLSARLLTIQDEERRHLARELHDSAGQYLAGIQMNLSALLRPNSGLADPARARVADSMEMADLCTSEIRTMSYLLHPLLDEMGLRSAISWYTEGFTERSKIRVDLQIPETFGRLPREIETALFRVLQQSLANIHRHSGSALAVVRIDVNAGAVNMEVRDEGRGMSPEVLAGFHSETRLLGVGLAGMRERVRGMGGLFEVRSTDKGVSIKVSLLLPASAQAASV